MEFSCGLTDEAWKRKAKEWHRWFAWHPVTVHVREDGSRVCAWLTFVERRSDYPFCDYDGRWAIWQYRRHDGDKDGA